MLPVSSARRLVAASRSAAQCLRASAPRRTMAAATSRDVMEERIKRMLELDRLSGDVQAQLRQSRRRALAMPTLAPELLDELDEPGLAPVGLLASAASERLPCAALRVTPRPSGLACVMDRDWRA